MELTTTFKIIEEYGRTKIDDLLCVFQVRSNFVCVCFTPLT